ncbi:SDR family NAD(P)-dependent oxidoreductase [Afifella sp. IM 167]|uniref:SDR family NAD(P)-dependent oxidoreductase n=1 Tax=Afifella sp. IM 167 TaxID=2033586 RepID=UPI001CCB4CAA|nr:SDR family oxidoreductase [Afifella sp. IM 167]MBZ8132379.1 hypothetical protein [Afifella sp. IM 167]
MTKHAVITGAASGIGADCCRDLLSRGWTVHGLDLDAEGLKAVAEAGSAGKGRFIAHPCDVAKTEAVEAAFAEVAKESPALDALICSAGIFRTGPVLTMSEADYDALFAINTKGAWLAARSALPLLRKAATKEAPARVVLVSSAAAIRPKIGGGAYAASKVALTYLARVMASELAGESILVNAIAPASVDTPLTQKLATDKNYKVSGASPLGRVAFPPDVTAVIRFLLSDDASYIAGAVLPIDGATTAAFRPG